ncbi:cobalt-precorrin-6A reductase [Streptomyces sp. BPTC-684]|uniref:cobalt-precorrin-6A reductase n=1 Tax=Streptomyces sp. BPTC-684 TaxID=3043734 RepID=UPI0024B10183|nr:cobalt-precorrin-6A reductase [Streptomyces sp. BPTC-684]WHM35457.1 cobalt-precorrin-6A reductase [Streptomyces sp. BPTC-684]
MPAPHALILGGTAEARALATALTATGMRVTTSLAGRVAEPRALPGELRTGGFGGAEGLARWMREHHVTALLDATHPFAHRISENAAEAAHRTGTQLIALRRPGWTPAPGDRWHSVHTLAEAAALLPTLGRRVFLTTGRLGLGAFVPQGDEHVPDKHASQAPHPLHDLWFLIRSVEPPAPPTPAHCQVLLARGPFTLEGERELLREHRIDVLVTKDSGGPATAAKLTAARELGLPVVVVRRPDPPAGVRTVPDVHTLLALLSPAAADTYP